MKRELRIHQAKLDKVLHGYGLFECNGNTFHSPKLDEVMKPFEQRRARIEAFKRQKQKENSLETSDVSTEKSDIVSFEGKGKGEGKGKTTSTKEEEGDDGAVQSPGDAKRCGMGRNGFIDFYSPQSTQSNTEVCSLALRMK